MSSIASQPIGANAAPATWSEAQSVAGVSPEERLLALIVFSQVSQMEAGKNSVDVSFKDLERLRAEVKEALQKAQEAQEHSGLFGKLSSVLGGDIGAIATALAAVAAVVATGGAAAAVLGVIAAAASIAAQHAKELGIPPEVGVAIGVVAAGAMLCTGNASGFFQVSDTVKTVAANAKVVASVVAGAANTAAGAASGAQGYYRSVGADEHANAREASGRQELTNVDIDQAIKLVSDALERQQSVTQAVSDGAMSHQASCQRILDSWGGAA